MSTYRLRVGENVIGQSITPEMGNPLIIKVHRVNGSFVDYLMPMDGTTVDIPDEDDSAFEHILVDEKLFTGSNSGLIQKTATEEEE